MFRFIVAGFANGIVALWDLATKSPLLLKDDTFCPVWSFYAHSSVVTGKFIITLQMLDKGIKFVLLA